MDSISTITGKVLVRTPTKSDSLSSRYTFLNLQNAEPNLGIPKFTEPKNEFIGDDGYRYFLLSNNNNSLSGWRAWSYNSPRIVAYSKENSIALGDNANPININSVVYNNHPYGTNIYNSQSFGDNTFNIFSSGGIFLFDATTIGDPASAVAFIVTEDGKVGINTPSPQEALTVVGNISAGSPNGDPTKGKVISDFGSNLGIFKSAINVIRGTVRIADSAPNVALQFGTGNTSYDTNLYRGGRAILKTDNTLVTNSLSSFGPLSGSDIFLTNANVTTFATPVTASGDFLVININGSYRAIRLWDF
jgi:hypothetical protein